MAKFVPRQRKHKVLARASAKENARRPIQDTNQEVLPADKADREEKKARIKADLLLGGDTPSGKKAKRLEKYLDNKLRKDENRELLAKLADRKIDTSLFASTRSIGQGRETKRQAISRALRETRAGLASQEADDILLERRRSPSGPDEEDGDIGGGDESDSHLQEQARRRADVAQPAAGSQLQKDQLAIDAASQGALEPRLSAAGAVGSGLKRPLELDDSGRPMIKKRQKRGGVESRARIEPRLSEQVEYEEWGGFTSEGDADGNPNRDISSEDESKSDDQSDLDSEHGSSQSSSQQDGDQQEALTEEDGEAEEGRAQRSSAFKAWAHQQRNQALGYQPVDSTADTPAMAKTGAFVPRVPENDPLPRELQPTTRTDRKAFTVTLDRRPEIQEARLKLPVVAEEQRLMEAIHEHDVVVVCGSTGSGKTTQVPQFLLEAGYGSPGSPTPGLIGITQPRRVAAVSMSKRVAEEVGDQAKSVAYQIRFEGTVDAQTAIKFMTDGVLLREVGQDITLGKYSAIIVDEAHERSVNTDILIGMLSRVVKLRAELAGEDATITRLKVIIMSATLRIEDLTMNPTLFATPPPVVEVEGRQHPVTIHFSRKTRSDYLDEAFRKISRGHRKLPPGGFLVFLTGRNEIHHLSRRLKAAFGGPGTSEMPRVQIAASEAPVEVEDLDLGEAVDETAHGDESDGWLSEEEEEEGEFQIEEDQPPAPLKMHILPLYSLLPTKEQLRVFEPVPDGYRQVVLATNVAETSLTIPGIRFVFDCGRSKERHYDRLSGVQSYEIGWISKASAGQRSGRAGRTGPGHCYRLYSSAVYERDFPEFAEPELLRMPVEGVVLRLKAMNLHKVVNFPFPTPPDRQGLAEAEKVLAYLSAVSADGRVTAVGKTMSIFPLSPRFARILLVGHLHDCMPYTIALVAGLSVGDIFVAENHLSGEGEPGVEEKDKDSEEATSMGGVHTDGEERAKARRAYGQVQRAFSFLDDRSDAIKLLQVVGEFAHEPTEAWCESHFVRYKALREAEQLRRQLTDLLRVNIPSLAGLGHKERLDAPTAKQVRALKQMVAAGFVDQVAIRADLAPEGATSGGARVRRARRAADVAYLPLVPLPAGARDGDGTGFVYIHPSSVLARLSPEECPEYVVYGYLQRATAGGGTRTGAAKTRMRPLTDVSGGQLSGLARGTPLLRYGKPIKEVGRPAAGATTRECWVVPYLRAEHVSGQGWPLPAKKVKQKRVPGKGWVVVDE